MLKHFYHLRVGLISLVPTLLQKRGITPYDMAIFKALFSAFELPLQSDYFRVMTMSDGKYELIIRYDERQDTYDVKYSIKDKIYSNTFV